MKSEDYTHLLKNPMLDDWEKIIIAAAISEMVREEVENG